MSNRFGPFTIVGLVVVAYFIWFWGFGRPRPSGRLEPSRADLGVVVLGSSRPLHFPLHNTGNVTLHVAREAHDCGCVQVNYPREGIAPGKTADLTVQFRAPAFASEFKESLRVYLSPGWQELTAEITGKTSPALVLETPGWMPIGGKAGRVKNTIVRDYRASPGQPLVAKVRGPDADCLAVRLTSKGGTLTAAEITLLRPPTHGTRNFYVDFTDPSDSGVLTTLTLHPL